MEKPILEPVELEELLFGRRFSFAKPEGQLIHVYGKAGCGKTTLALQIVYGICKEDKKTLFINTEKKISGKKIKDIVGRENFPTINNSLILYSPADFDEQHNLIQRLEFFILNQKIGMIIVDTITNLYRQNLVIGRNDKQKYERLAFQVAFLHKLSREKNIPIIIFNQATIQKGGKEQNKQSLEQERISPVAQAIMNYWADRQIILINRGFGNFEGRIASQFDKRVRFSITKEGIGRITD